MRVCGIGCIVVVIVVGLPTLVLRVPCILTVVTDG